MGRKQRAEGVDSAEDQPRALPITPGSQGAPGWQLASSLGTTNLFFVVYLIGVFVGVLLFLFFA